MKIAFIGGPGVRKTTVGMRVTTQLALSVATALKERGISAAFVGEFARTWMAKGQTPPRNVGDQAFIMRGQRKREMEAQLTGQIVVTDSTTWMCVAYASNYLRQPDGTIHPADKENFEDLMKDALDEEMSYDLVFYLPRCVPYDANDKGRTQKDEESAILMDKKIRGMAYLFEIPVIDLPADLDKWYDISMRIIEEKLGLVRTSIVSDETDYSVHAVA